MQNLKQKTIVSFLWDFSGLIVGQVVALLISIVLARLLTPADYGLLAMASVFVFIFNIFIDVGFSSALIQSNNNTSLTYSSIFYVNIFTSLIILLLVEIMAPFVGDFYRDQRVTDIIRILALLLPLGALSNVQNAILNKELKFAFITKRNIVSQIFGGILGITAAFMGFGVYALIISSFASQILSTILIWSVTTWKPDLKFSIYEVKRLFNYSLFIFLTTFTGNIFNQLNSLFIGKIFSASTLGYYNIAVNVRDRVSTSTSSSIKKVLFPVMSSVKDDQDRFISIYNKALKIISFFSFSIVGTLYFWSDFIIRFLYGAKWISSIPILKVLILIAIFSPIGSLMIDALISKGYSKENFYLDLIKKINAVLVIVVGYFFGFQMMMYAFFLQTILNTVINTIFLKIYLDFPVRKISANMAICLLLLFLCIFLYEYIHTDIYFLKEILCSLLFLGLFLYYQYIFERDNILYILSILKSYKKK